MRCTTLKSNIPSWRYELELETKRPNLVIPSYSVKEDVIPYLNCRLQYRYRNVGSLPYARPERFWFGLFIHGALELAYRYWRDAETPPAFPWPCTKLERRGDAPNWQDHDIGKFANDAETSLRNQGVRAPSAAARNSAYGKVATMVNALGAHLFPLIDSAEHVERRITATRQPDSGRSRYELRGVLDALARAVPNIGSCNRIREYVRKACPDIRENSELILEYKASCRPAPDSSHWKQDELQVQAYAWLRGQELQSGKLPAAGVVIYVNELPDLDRAIRVILNELPELDKAVRVIPISRRSADSAIAEVDAVALQIEDALAAEATGGSAIRSWPPNCVDKTACADCDFRHFCPKPAGMSASYAPKAPASP